jgi:hypothetical protein
MQTDTKEFPTALLLALVYGQEKLVMAELPGLYAWLTGESWQPKDYPQASEICIPWLRTWFPELSMKVPQALPKFYHVPQINR